MSRLLLSQQYLIFQNNVLKNWDNIVGKFSGFKNLKKDECCILGKKRFHSWKAKNEGSISTNFSTRSLSRVIDMWPTPTNELVNNESRQYKGL
jgi:hypothetical protein